MFQKTITTLVRLATPVRNLWVRSSQTEATALDSYLSQAQSISHLEALQRSWDRRQDRNRGFGHHAQ
ncbi:hypothetical protein [Hydrogenophaga sp.]|uniref:hypothetical protein n=1 Tax=Hydrogenophaga sp. TaxID=1904254 RepID=UPI0025C3CB3B|nr:hypothetical protein [Hydrogenophaga sp.]